MGVLCASWAVLGMLMVLGSSWVCFESFLATSWGCLGASSGVFLDVLRAARVVSGSFLSPRYLDRVAKWRSSRHVFLKAHGVAVTWFQSGRASAASERSERSVRKILRFSSTSKGFC